MSALPLRHYCTLFDSNYLLKGLALYRSLERHGGPFRLHVLCMDDAVHGLLARMRLPQLSLIRRQAFEDPELLAVKPSRSVAEYCWTCTPSLALFVLRTQPDIDLVTYLDADLYFFSSPQPIFDELGEHSILIVGHRFAPRFAHLEVNGKYNVEWLTFRRDGNGLAALQWWRDKCIEWCFHRLEGDRMGDQKYLDTWPERFAGVHVLRHVGAGVAPWNFSQYAVEERPGGVYVDGVPLIFYHFHGFSLLPRGRSQRMADMYRQDARPPQGIYARYEAEVSAALAFVRSLQPGFSQGIAAGTRDSLVRRLYWTLPEAWRAAYRRLKGLA